MNTAWCITPKSSDLFYLTHWMKFLCVHAFYNYYKRSDVFDVNMSALIHSSLWSQIIVTLLECSITQSSPPGPSSLLLRTLDSCWLLQENSRTTCPKAVGFLHGKLWLNNMYHSNLSGGWWNKTAELQQLISLALLIVSFYYLASVV